MTDGIYENQEEMRQEAFRKLYNSYIKVESVLSEIKCPFHKMAQSELEKRMERAETDAEIERLDKAEYCEFCIVDYGTECETHGELQNEVLDQLKTLLGFMRGLIKWKTWECECGNILSELVLECLDCITPRPEDVKFVER